MEGSCQAVGQVPFAWKLKQVCHDLYDWAGLREPEFYETPEGAALRDVPLPTIGKSPVAIWIDMGTPAVRDHVYDKTWIDYVLKRDHGYDVIVVPDCRFENEVEALREKNATLVKVVRPGYGPRNSVADRALLGFTGWDYVIGASGEMEELQDWAVRFARWYAGEGPKPRQSDDEKRAAMAVEGI